MNDKLTPNFTIELLAHALDRRTTFEIVKQHLKFSYLQDESEKKLWQWITRQFEKLGRIPSFGQIQQNFNNDDAVLELLADISDIEIDEKEGHDSTLISFEKYIRQMKFLEANDKIADTYNRGEKEKAYGLFTEFAEDMFKFSLISAKFETVFGNFNERQIKRKSEDYSFRFKVPTGIDEIDFRLGGQFGGPETGEFVLWLGDSGSGKSQLMVHIGITAARQGIKVAHFQLEGTKEQCLNRYDAAWTGTLYQDMKLGNITAKKMEIAQRIIKKLSRNDIIISSEESFSAKTLVDVHRELKEMEKVHGSIGCIIIDYLELLEVGDGHLYTPHEERFRQAKLSKGMKMLAMEFNAVVHVPTQSSSISEEEKNDPAFVITRAKLSEDKGKLRPADIFITINQTRDEAKEEIMRLHTDKLRDYQNGDPIFICNKFSYARFYDRKRTLNMDWEADE